MKNIIQVVVDCARAEKTILKYPKDNTLVCKSARLPFLSRLRKEGMTYTNFNSISSTTTPNFASMFTGLLPLQHGIKEHSRYSLPKNITTLAEVLKMLGYNTFAEMTGPMIPEVGLDKGFDHYRYRPRTEYLHTGFFEYLQKLIKKLPEPYFLCLHLWEAHGPYQPGKYKGLEHGQTTYDQALTNVDFQLLKLFQGTDLSKTCIMYMGDHGERLVEDWDLNKRLGGNEYKIFDETKRHFGPPNQAWFEHCKQKFGEAKARIYAHNVKGHGFHLTEDLIRVPLVISTYNEDGINNMLNTQLDIFSTILDIAGLKEYKDFCREDRESLLKNPKRKFIYIEANGSGGKQFKSKCYLRGLKTNRFKFWKLESPIKSCYYDCLWDLKEDPREICNQSSKLQMRVDDLRYELDMMLYEMNNEQVNYNTDDEEKIEKKLKELGYID